MNYPNWFEMTAKHNFQTYLAEFKDKPNLKFLNSNLSRFDSFEIMKKKNIVAIYLFNPFHDSLHKAKCFYKLNVNLSSKLT